MDPQPILDAFADVKDRHDDYAQAATNSTNAAAQLMAAQKAMGDALNAQDQAKAAVNASLDALEVALETAFRAK